MSHGRSLPKITPILSIVMRELHTELPDAMGWLCEHRSQVETKFFEALQNVPSFGPEMYHQLWEYIVGMAVWPRSADCSNFEGGCYFGSKGLEIQKTRRAPLLPNVNVDLTLERGNVRVLPAELKPRSYLLASIF
jgi:hypothetical protein